MSCSAGSSQCLATASSHQTSAAASEVVGAASPAKSQGQGPGQGRYLNLAGALTGELKRQVLNGAKRTLSTLAGDTNEYNLLEREILGFTHCLNLAPEKLRAATFASMVKDMAEARKCMRSLEFPVPCLLKLCEKHAAGLIKKEMFAEFSACLRIWHSKSDRKFSETAPQYGALIAQRCTDKDSIYMAACSLRDSFFFKRGERLVWRAC